MQDHLRQPDLEATASKADAVQSIGFTAGPSDAALSHVASRSPSDNLAEPIGLALLAVAFIALGWLRGAKARAIARRGACAWVAVLTLWAGSADGAAITFNYSFTADAIGTGFAPFGFASVPAGPFSATVTIDGPLLANQHLDSEVDPIPGLSGSATIGDYTFAGATILAVLDTDAAARLVDLAVGFRAADALLALHFSFDAAGRFATQWIALDGRLAAGCSFVPDPPRSIVGPCLGGGASTLSVDVVDSSALPGPTMLSLLGLALACLAVARHRGRGRVGWGTRIRT